MCVHAMKRRALRVQEQATRDGLGHKGGGKLRRLARRVLRGTPMSIVIHPGRLRQEMSRRGWAAVDLAREARLSQATVSTALHGKPIAEKSFALMAKALSRTPVLDVADSLIMRNVSDMTLD